jgi:hypothetical protein
VSSFGVQAVTRRRFPADGSPARQLLQPETTRAVMEMAGRPASGNDAMGHFRPSPTIKPAPDVRFAPLATELAWRRNTSRQQATSPAGPK